MIWKFMYSLAYLQASGAGHRDMWSWLVLWASGPSVFACATSRYNMCTACETFVEAQFAFRRSWQCDSELDREIELEYKELNNEPGILLR